jgi:polysaccharide chain length determinant protein (PEP-CTERM system associated)
MNVEGGIQISDIWGVVRRRGKVVGGTALVIVLAAYWIAMALPNEYSSFATVLVQPQTVDPGLVTAGVPESDINNRLFLMTAQILSRGRLSRIIDDLELYPEESEYLVREEIIDLMRSMVTVAPVISELSSAPKSKNQENINQFKIQFTDKNARTAMEVASKLSNDFIEQHIDSRISQSQKSLEFIEGELTRLADRIRDIEARVAEVKAENPGRLPEDMAASQRRLERVTSDLSFAQRAYSEATSDEAFFRSQISNAQVVASHEEITPARRMKSLELLLADHVARGYTAKHPDVVKTNQEIAALKAQISRQESAADLSDEDANKEESMTFAQQNAEAERRRAVLRRDSAEGEISRLQAAIDDVQTLLAETPAVAELLDGLEREYQHLFRSYQDFSKRQLEATVQAQLERRQLGEQFKVLEAAFIAPEPTSPNRILIIAFGAVFALAIGFGVGIVLEGVDGSVHSARQLQAVTGIPVLAAIPAIRLEADLRDQRRARMRSIFGAGAITVVALVGGYMNHMWVNGVPGFLAGAGAEVVETVEGEQAEPADTPAAEGDAGS